jgi:hypothetical protein
MSPDAALPDSHYRRMSPSVARCRRSLGQILGQPMLPWGSSPCSEDLIRSPHHLPYGLIRRLFLAEPAHSVRAMSL